MASPGKHAQPWPARPRCTGRSQTDHVPTLSVTRCLATRRSFTADSLPGILTDCSWTPAGMERCFASPGRGWSPGRVLLTRPAERRGSSASHRDRRVTLRHGPSRSRAGEGVTCASACHLFSDKWVGPDGPRERDPMHTVKNRDYSNNIVE